MKDVNGCFMATIILFFLGVVVYKYIDVVIFILLFVFLIYIVVIMFDNLHALYYYFSNTNVKEIMKYDVDVKYLEEQISGIENNIKPYNKGENIYNFLNYITFFKI